MLTVPQAVELLSTPRLLPAIPNSSAEEICYCWYCRQSLHFPPHRLIPTEPRFCHLLRSNTLQRHELVCEECAQISTSLWYYQGRGGLTLDCGEMVQGIHLGDTVLMTAVQLDVYVWLLRLGFPERYTPCNVSHVSAGLGYSQSAVRIALDKLCRAGLLLKQRQGRINWYRPLIFQLPKGE